MLGRLTQESTTGGETVQHVYTQNDDLYTLANPPAGENSKKVQTEYDGLGRVSKVCQINSASSNACGQATGSANGASDVYAYNSFPGQTVVSVVRNGTQTRKFTYDGLGRLTQKLTPEGGTWNYYYDTANSACSGDQAHAGKLTCMKDANGNQTIYFYDALGRVTDVGAGAGSTSCKRFRYDNTGGYNGGTPPGFVYANQLGRLTEAETDDCTSVMFTDEWFTYDKDGRRTDLWESTPHSGQYYHSVATFFENGAPKTVQLASPSVYTMTYTLDGEGRWYSLTDTTNSKTLVYSDAFNPSGQPTAVNLIGSGSDNDAYTYDSNTGAMKTYTFTVGSTPVSLTGTLNWNQNGTLGSLATVDGFNAGGSLTCASGYDDTARLTTFDCGSGNWGQTYSYDPYDNLSKSVISGRSGTNWSPGYSSTTNHYSSGTYDSNGNVTGDGNNTFQWDEYSKMKSSTSSGIPTCGSSGKCITYDAFGRMVEQSNGIEFCHRNLGRLDILNEVNDPMQLGRRELQRSFGPQKTRASG